MPSDRPRQSLDNLRGEVRFRRFHGTDETGGLTDYIRKSVAERTGVFTHLLLRGRPLTPFVELGCETAANGLSLVERLGQRGFSVDISLDALRAVDRYRRELGFAENPLRICCDMNNLPLRTGAIRFALAWGTLHHFPDPRAPLAEVRRVLARAGLFYFDGEPVRRLLSLNLSATRSIYTMSPLARLLLRLRLLPWIFAIDGAEAIAHGALEMKFSANQWRRFLPEVFEEVRFRWRAYLTADIRSTSRPVDALLRLLLGAERAEKAAAALFGGTVYGEANKLPDLTGMRLPDGGEMRLAIKKPQGNDRLILTFAGPRMPLTDGPPVRIGFETLTPESAEGDDVYYRLTPYQTGDGVLDLRVPSLTGNITLTHLATDGPGGYVGCDVNPAPEATPGETGDVDMESLLACPRCRVPGERIVSPPEDDRPPLRRVGDRYACDECGTEYPIVDGIAVLLRPSLARDLGYPTA